MGYLHIPCQHTGLPNSFRKCGLRSWHLLRRRRPRANCIAKRVSPKFCTYIFCVNMIVYVWKILYIYFRFRFICSLIFVLQYPTCICTCIYDYICICICTYVCIYNYKYKYVYVYMYMYRYMCLRIRIRTSYMHITYSVYNKLRGRHPVGSEFSLKMMIKHCKYRCFMHLEGLKP